MENLPARARSVVANIYEQGKWDACTRRMAMKPGESMKKNVGERGEEKPVCPIIRHTRFGLP